MKTGRPEDYNERIAKDICEQIAAGKSLRSICEQDGMPSMVTVRAWRLRHPEFLTMYAIAREDQGDLMDEMILRAAMQKPQKDALGKTDGGEVAHRRLLIDTLKWRACHLRPRVYSEKHRAEMTAAVALRNLVNVPGLKVPAGVGNDQAKLDPDSGLPCGDSD
jgi:hypothetical protein